MTFNVSLSERDSADGAAESLLVQGAMSIDADSF
jgi:hypothetical protein